MAKAKKKIMKGDPRNQDPAGNGLFSGEVNRLKRMDDAINQAQTGKKKKKRN